MRGKYALGGLWSGTTLKEFGGHSHRSGEYCQVGSSRMEAKEEGAATPVDDHRLQASARLPASTSLRIT